MATIEPTARRKFLVVVDDTAECRVATRFAARRAEHTGGLVTLLFVVAPPIMQQWRGVERIMREEAMAEAEAHLHTAAGKVHALTGITPELVIREGKKRDEVLALIKEDRAISILVLAAGVGKEGPGPLVSMVASESKHAYPLPVTVVPGDLTDEEIADLA